MYVDVLSMFSQVLRHRGAKITWGSTLMERGHGILTPSDIQHSAATQIWRCYRLVSRAKHSCLSSSADTTFCLHRFGARQSFWGADEEITDRISLHDHCIRIRWTPDTAGTRPDYVPEPVYPEYIPLEDEHVFPAEEQPLPPVDSPTAESTRYITESDPKEDPEEYEDDKTKDGPVDYPMDGGDDGDDDDDDSSRDDADDEDEDKEDEEEEEEEEHPALVDFAVVVPTVEPVSPT
ncbi:hypothetical protein Tco_1242619 [Tanacetum coccineum]